MKYTRTIIKVRQGVAIARETSAEIAPATDAEGAGLRGGFPRAPLHRLDPKPDGKFA
jgi:hypothetical protein